MEHYIYIIFSATPHRIGKMIRYITKEQYNHVSVSLDEEMTQMYAFARRHYHTPLHGGFVKECPSRFFVDGKNAEICLCKLPVTDAQFKAVEAELSRMYQSNEGYLYNHLSAMSSIIHKRIVVRNAYTCVEFCVKILQMLGFAVITNRFYTLEDLQKMLRSYVVYSGKMPQPNSFDSTFFAKQSFLPAVYYTLRDIVRLIPRSVRK